MVDTPRAEARRVATLRTILIGTAAFIAAPAAHAQDWTGANSADWFDAGNWNVIGPPGIGEDAFIDIANGPVVAAAAPEFDVLYIGSLGDGALTVLSGGSIENLYTHLGFDPAFAGSLTVSGASATLSSAFGMLVGFSGAGDVTISDGGVVDGSETYLGALPDSFGSGLVTGAGSVWRNDFGGITVGFAGDGELTISDGGLVTGVGGVVGGLAGSTGTMLLTGAGSRWEDTDGLLVGFEGEGALTISDGAVAQGSYGVIGGFLGASGDVLVTGAGSAWNVEYEIWVAAEGEGALTIADGATVSAAEVIFAELPGAEGSITIGGVGAAAVPGAFSAPTLEFGDGDGALVFNHTGGAYTFATELIGGAPGASVVAFTSGVTRLTGDSSAFAGEASVTGGAAYFNNAFGGDVTVASGGVVGGSGDVGDLRAGAAGIVAPGNSIGVLSAASAQFDAGSIYRVEVNASGQADLLDVSGAVTIAGGTVDVVAEFAPYAPLTQYTIIRGASVAGAFTDARTNFAFLTPALSYAADEVFLTLAPNGVDFSALARNRNQANAADALQQHTLSTLFMQALLLTGSDAARAFGSLSGEAHPTTLGATLLGSLGFIGQVDGQLMQLSQAPAQIQLASLSADAPLRSEAGNRFWAEAYGAWGEFDGDAHAEAYDSDRNGLVLGFDHGDAGRGLIGVALGFSDGAVDVDALASSADVESHELAVYGGLPVREFILRGSVGYARHDTDSARTATIGALTERLSASYDMQAASIDAEIARPFRWRRGSVEPFLALSHIALEADGFTETGGGAALTVDDADAAVTFSTLGARASHGLGVRDGVAALYGSLAWRHASGDTIPRATMAFASNPGVGFSIDGAPIAEDAVAIEAGVNVAVAAQARLSLGYRGDVAEDASDHGARARFSWRF